MKKMKKSSIRILTLLIVMVMILSMSSTLAFSSDGSITTATDLKASMQNANLLPSPTNVDERAARGNYLPYTGYFEETFTSGPATGRSVRIYIPQGAYIRNYDLAIALPSGTDVEEFLVNSGWIDIAEANRLCLMILLPNGTEWGSYADEKAYLGTVLDGYTSGRRWYSIYSEFYLAGYGDGGNILQQWAGENPLFVISQAYFDSSIDANALVTAGEYYYVPSGQTALTSATPAETTFECVKKKDIPVPTYFFGSSTPQGAIDYWKYSNECDASVQAGAGPLGSDIFFQNKVNSKAIATGVSNVVSRVAVLAEKVDYVNPEVSQEVYDGLAVYTRYTNSSAWSNALGFRPDREALGIETVDFWTKEEGGKDFKRQYTIYVPEIVKNKELYPNGAPVLYAFGGNGNNTFQYFEASQYVELADTYGFSVVMPSEHTSSNGVTTTWRIGEDEYNFVKAVMEQVNAKYGQYFDQNRLFAVGHSQGGGMTNYLSMRDPNLFTAYAVMAGLAQTFPAGTPTVPMYAIYGEYDSVSYATNRAQWLKRNSFNEADGVITDPFDLPTRYNNSIQYLIHPDTTEYPGDKYVTISWYDQNGIPMFNDTTAYGREHNNTVPDMRRIWTEWFSKWGRDEDGNREYGYIFDGVVAPLKMDQENAVNSGSAIPVKFALKDFNGKYVGSAKAELYYAPVISGTVGAYQPAFSKGDANAENAFKFSAKDNQYVFNMDTKGLAAGSYRLKIVLDGSRQIKMDITIIAKGNLK
jgi:S-formylglutathione hydrolase FrmB